MSTIDDKRLDDLLGEAFADEHAPRTLVDRTRAALRGQASGAGRASEAEQPQVAVQPPEAEQPAAAELLRAAEKASDVKQTSGAGRQSEAERPSPARRRPRRWASVAAIAACLLLAVVVPLGIHVFRDVTTVVSIDVNPSVELSLNRFDRVVEARGMNDDGEALLQAVSVGGMTCDDAVEALLASDAVQRAASGGNPVEVVVSSLDGSETSGLETQVARACEAAGCAARCSSAQADEHAAASELGLTVGKYRMYETLHDHGCDIDADAVSSMTMRELRDLAAQYGCDDGEENGSGMGSQGGNGNGFGSCMEDGAMRGRHHTSGE